MEQQCSRQAQFRGESCVIQARRARPPNKVMALVMESRMELMTMKEV